LAKVPHQTALLGPQQQLAFGEQMVAADLVVFVKQLAAV
jgi:hypothetical protein